jgi:hypothetical protein
MVKESNLVLEHVTCTQCIAEMTQREKAERKRERLCV